MVDYAYVFEIGICNRNKMGISEFEVSQEAKRSRDRETIGAFIVSASFRFILRRPLTLIVGRQSVHSCCF